LIFKHDNSNAIATELKQRCLDLAKHHIRKRTLHNKIRKWRSRRWTLSWYWWTVDTSNALTWWTAKETEVSNYSIKDWNSASHWNNEEKSSSFHLSSYEEFEWSTHHLHNVDDDKTKSSWSHLAKAKTLNVFEEVSWQNHKRT